MKKATKAVENQVPIVFVWIGHAHTKEYGKFLLLESTDSKSRLLLVGNVKFHHHLKDFCPVDTTGFKIVGAGSLDRVGCVVGWWSQGYKLETPYALKKVIADCLSLHHNRMMKAWGITGATLPPL